MLQNAKTKNTPFGTHLKDMVEGDDMVEESSKRIGKEQDDSSLFSNSQSAICLAKNPILHSRCKPIELNYHSIINLINDGDLFLLKIPSAKNPTDMLTKTVTTTKLRLCIASIGLQEN